MKRPSSFPDKQSQLIAMIHFEFFSTQSIGSSKTSRDPERMYKIVLAGDAAVGKSSFIMRLCKGKFVPNLSSTLGTDTQSQQRIFCLKSVEHFCLLLLFDFFIFVCRILQVLISRQRSWRLTDELLLCSYGTQLGKKGNSCFFIHTGHDT